MNWYVIWSKGEAPYHNMKEFVRRELQDAERDNQKVRFYVKLSSKKGLCPFDNSAGNKSPIINSHVL